MIKKIFLIVGARPNFMKVSPILEKFKKHPDIKSVLIHTGQHYDYTMSKVFFEDLNIPVPDVNLGIGSCGHGEQTGKIMIGLEKIYLKEKPDLVVVFGDVNSTLAGALVASKLNIPVAHIEAGIRSYNNMPEETNRLLTDHISEYLFTTSKYEDENLKKEGISPNKIFCVGNIMIDSLIKYKEIATKRQTFQKLLLEKKKYVLCTLHRAGNVDDKNKFRDIICALAEISKSIPVVCPVHPRTRKNISNFGFDKFFTESKAKRGENTKIQIIEPLSYIDCLNLEMNAKFVITDSGGIQVETTTLGVSCLTILDKPVWAITHKEGTNVLVKGNGKELIKQAMKIVNKGHVNKKRLTSLKLWDGKTADRIVKILIKKL
ncbi:MAG: UDP-N-acetylglucosamine 2-epimerase (non-hydrolyzing) [bacterium]|nr:UDP-N-acetylglucosamine 2-epimerase (non-hydrolyzing) [bacterium]